jgi:hypothetical protein
MRNVSSVWASNHAVRLLTTTVSATAALASYKALNVMEGSRKQEKNFWLTSAILSYIIVWITAAAPGYVSDMLFDALQRKIASIMLQIHSTGDPTDPNDPTDPKDPTDQTDLSPDAAHGDQEIDQEKLFRKCTLLMQSVQALEGREGMHFVHVPMSTTRALTVGTVLGYLMLWVIRGGT